MHPELSRIGVNSEPEHIAVIDVFDWYENDGKEPWPWADPVTVPSSGSAALPVTAYAELPSEPVPNLGSRGCPIMLFFRHGHPQLSEFSGSLQEAKGRRVVDVPCLVADRGDFPNVYGIVPQEPLKSGTSYVAEFSYTSAGEVVRKSIHFKTE
jgi:hypothetical protein